MTAPGSQRIARSTGILALSTGLSRVLGFVRDLLIAQLFGASIQAQAFVVAFRLPNVMRDLVAEGAVTSAFVPVLSWYRAEGPPQEFWRLSHALLTRLFLLLAALGVAGAALAPHLVRVVAPGFAGEPDKFALTVTLTRILFPFVTLVGLWAFFMGLLNSLRHFAVPALGPAVLNLAMIAACVWFVPGQRSGAVALAIGVMVGGVVQLVIQIPVAMRLGFRWRWRWRHPGAQEVLRQLGPRLVGSAVYQASVLIETALASLGAVVGEGAVVALYFANRLVQLPLALFGTTAAQASLPSLAEHAARGDLAAFRQTVLALMRMTSFVVLPSAAGLVALSAPIVRGLLERGAFDARASALTAQALGLLALGLWAFSMSKGVTGAFYALRDTWTPVRLAIEAVALNVVLSVLLMWPLGLGGLALAAALSNTMNIVRLIRRLERRLAMPILRPLAGPLARMGLAAAAMAAGCRALWSLLASQPAWCSLPLVILAGCGGYGLACAWLRVEELSMLLRWIGQQIPRPASANR